MDGISLTMENTRFNQVIKWNESILIGKNHQNLMVPHMDILKALCWKVRCPSKIQHFLWQILSGCIAVMKNLKTREIQGDICCARCGDPEESINHVFFECPLAHQVWALSKIPSNPIFFLLVFFSPIWIIYFGESIQGWMTTIFHGYYGIYGNVGITKCLVIWLLIQGTH